MTILSRLVKFFTPPTITQIPLETEEHLKITEVENIVLNKIKIGKEKQEKNVFFTPTNFSEYIGQERAKDTLTKYISGTTDRNLPFPHTLLYAKAGMGKTTLAKIITQMLNKDLVEIISSTIPKDENILQETIKSLNGKVLFIDEIHSLPRKEAETIYSMMENFSYNGIPIEPFTLIGATTELGEIIKNRKPFYDRFKLVLELEDYSLANLTTIIRQYRRRMFAKDRIMSNHYKILAENCRNTPRIAIRLVESLVYFQDNIREVLNNFGILYKSYTKKDLLLLSYLEKSKVVGLQGIASYLDTSKENYLYNVEPYLIQTGIIMRYPNGRAISEAGRTLLKKLRSIDGLSKNISYDGKHRKKIVQQFQGGVQ